MKKSFKTLFALAIACFTNHCFVTAQPTEDPFATAYTGGQSVNEPFANIGELPQFKHFIEGIQGEIKITPIEPIDLKSLMDSKNRMFVIDTREENEFDVSHLQGAKRVGYEKFSVEKVWMLDRNTTIILYSTDGERCAHVGAYMKMMGFVDVRTINGSLIGWVNAGYPAVDKEGNSTTNVFVNNKEEAKKLKKGKAIFAEDKH